MAILSFMNVIRVYTRMNTVYYDVYQHSDLTFGRYAFLGDSLLLIIIKT